MVRTQKKRFLEPPLSETAEMAAIGFAFFALLFSAYGVSEVFFPSMPYNSDAPVKEVGLSGCDATPKVKKAGTLYSETKYWLSFSCPQMDYQLVYPSTFGDYRKVMLAATLSNSGQIDLTALAAPEDSPFSTPWGEDDHLIVELSNGRSIIRSRMEIEADFLRRSRLHGLGPLLVGSFFFFCLIHIGIKSDKMKRQLKARQE